MPTASFRRRTTLLLVVAVLALPWAASAGPRTEAPVTARAAEPASLEVLDFVWSFLRSIWSKSNCGIDPSGVCATDTAPLPQAKSNCQIDPSGACRP